jgi:hypothetical protein
MITSINEFKKYVVNEGGGAGIEFKLPDVFVELEYKLYKKNDEYKIDLRTSTVTYEGKLSAIGYEDGINDVDATNMFQTDVPTPDDKLFDIIYDVYGDGTRYTARQILDDAQMNEVFMSFQLYVDYSKMYSAGYIRSDVNVGDVIFTGKDTDTDATEIEGQLEWNEDGNKVVGDFDDDNADNNNILTTDYVSNHMLPTLKATKKFVEMYNNVFNFQDNISDLIRNNVTIAFDNGDIDDYLFQTYLSSGKNKYNREDVLEIGFGDTRKDELPDLINDIVDVLNEDESYITYLYDVHNDDLNELYK